MDGKIILKGKKNSVVKYLNAYLIVSNDRANDLDYISQYWANNGTRLALDTVVKQYCETSLDIDNI